MTVRGPVAPEALGPTMMHEHVFLDVRDRWRPGDSTLTDAGTRPFEARFAGASRWSSHTVRDNLALDPVADLDMVREEVAIFRDATSGAGCLVELTPEGIGAAPQHLRRLAEHLDMAIVSGAGFYVEAHHPSWVARAEQDQLTEHIVAEVEVGRAGTSVRAGIIGEIGTSEALHPEETRVLRAASRAARRTGVAVNVHCHPGPREVTHRILDIIESEGLDLSRVYLSHLDEIADHDYLASVADRGVTIGFDSFGQEGYFSPRWRALSDMEKGAMLMWLAGRGHGEQLVVGQDVCKKQHLARFGGMGYDHVVSRVAPRLREHEGMTVELERQVLVGTPRRLLTKVEPR